MPGKRILYTLLNFDIAVIIFTVFSVVRGTYTFSIKRFLLSLVGLESYGNSNWYIFCILAMYLCAYVIFLLFGKKNKLIVVAGLWGLTLGYIIVLRYILQKDIWWYDTVLCFPLGCTFSILKKYFEKILNSNIKNIIFVVLMAVVFCLATNYKYLPSVGIIIGFIRAFAFVFIIVGVTKIFPPQSRILEWFGKNLFPIYIYQRLPMIILSDLGKISNDLYLAVVLISTVLIAVIYKFALSGIKTLIQNKKVGSSC